MKKAIPAIFLSLMLMTTSACAATFSGTVVDADTGQPIEGAVVVAKWMEELATPAGPSQGLKDVKETLTDKEGRWEIKGPKGRDVGKVGALTSFLTGATITTPPEFIIYKPGYCPYPKGYFIDACEKMYVTETDPPCDDIGCGETVGLPKLTERKDRRQAHRVGPVYGADNNKEEREILRKQREFIRLINQEKRYLGLEEYKYDFIEGNDNAKQ